jgi:RNase P subunit RPR2
MKCPECGFDNVQRDICSQCNAGLSQGDETDRVRSTPASHKPYPRRGVVERDCGDRRSYPGCP